MGANDELINDPDDTEALDHDTTDNDMEVDGDKNIDTGSLECDMSEAEVNEEIRMFKNGKAAGPDMMISAYFKNAAGSVVPFLARYFNKLFSSGLYPDNWSVKER